MKKNILVIIYICISTFSYSQSDKYTYKKIDKTLKLIENQYVDTVNMTKIVSSAIKAMIDELDPHSKYLSKKTLIANNENLNGSFGGIGIRYQILDDTLIVLNTIPGGPSEKAGIKSGDKLIAINDEIVAGKKLKNSNYSNLLRGKNGSKVKLNVISHDTKQIKEINISRGKIPIKTVVSNYMLDKNSAYIKISSFSKTTVYEFQLALMQLKLEGMENLVLDLRDNPGGLMLASIELADIFLEEKKLIVYTKGQHLSGKEYYSKDNGAFEDGRLIVLMDENSASASEIFSGAIQDWDRGLIMGRRSYGKGLIGRNFKLPDGSAIRLTIGRYYTPSGRSIQRPYNKGKVAYQKDFMKRYETGEVFSADSIHFHDSLKYYTNKNRLVYGGGAIMPDIFLPLDTSFYSDYLKEINHYGVVHYYAGVFFDKNLEVLLKKYPDFKSFDKHFNMSNKSFNNMISYAKSKYDIEANEEEISTSKEYIRTSFKALLARNLYGNPSYYQVINQYDTEVNAAKDLIKNKKAFRENNIHY